MAYRVPNVGSISARLLPRIRYIAELHGVSVEHLVETIRARRRYHRARMYRQRSRRRYVEKNPKARKGFLLMGQANYAGESELHAFLRQLDWTQKQFAEYAGIHPSAFTRWRGHPLARWPVELMRLLLWSQRMAEFLRSKGYDPDKFSPVPLPPMPTGRYPRKNDQIMIDGKPLSEWSPWKR